MKLSTKSEYALLALIDLAEHQKSGLIKITDICVRKNIPKKYLEQILLILKGSGLVQSKRGSGGGYRLAKEPKQISLASSGSVSKFFYEKTPIEQNSKLLDIFKEIRDYISDKMEATTLDQLI